MGNSCQYWGESLDSNHQIWRCLKLGHTHNIYIYVNKMGTHMFFSELWLPSFQTNSLALWGKGRAPLRFTIQIWQFTAVNFLINSQIFTLNFIHQAIMGMDKSPLVTPDFGKMNIHQSQLFWRLPRYLYF